MKKRLGAGILIFIAGYFALSIERGIPDEVLLPKGEKLELHAKVPVTYERKEEETEAVSLILNQKNKTGGNYLLSCKLFGLFEVKEVSVQEVSRQQLVPGGIPVGIYVKTDGVLVIGTSPITAADGETLEPAKYLLRSGDYIQSVNGEEVDTKEELMEKINRYGKEELTLGLERNGEEIELAVEPVLVKDQSYKLGIWVRDDLAGVGTMTYAEETGEYGALGHGVSDADTSTLIDMERGLLYQTNIIGIIKGHRGTPGELSGVINYSSQYCLGSVKKNTKAGVYGKLNELPQKLLNVEKMPVGYKQEIKLGKAEIICSLKGERKSYEIEITETSYHSREANKGIQFEVTDEELLSLTGGIVQGMSGSPIIQNGRIVGAVTHVFVNDPTKGYGIFIENMLENHERKGKMDF